MLDKHASLKQIMSIRSIKHAVYCHKKHKECSILRVSSAHSLLRHLLPLVGVFAISSDGFEEV